MTNPRKPTKATPRKGSSRKTAAKPAVRKSRARPGNITGSEIRRQLAEHGGHRPITGDYQLTGREEALLDRPGRIEVMPPPCLSNEDLCAVQRLLDNGHFNDVDAAVAKVRELRYGYNTPPMAVACSIADEAWAHLHALGDLGAASASCSISGLNLASRTASVAGETGDLRLGQYDVAVNGCAGPLPDSPIAVLQKAIAGYTDAVETLRTASRAVLYTHLPDQL